MNIGHFGQTARYAQGHVDIGVEAWVNRMQYSALVIRLGESIHHCLLKQIENSHMEN